MRRTSMLLYVLVTFTMFFLEPATQQAHAQEAAPPAPDETLIYFHRGKGGGGHFWIAVNDQTVARVGKREYAVVRAKAGRITLNLATAGIVLTTVAVDDRPGETVYLTWGIRDWQVTELDEAAGRELIADSKQTEPIDEALGNNEEIRALLDLHRLGSGLMQPSTQEMSPDSDHAVLTIFRREKAKKDGFRREIEVGIWGERGYLGTLSANEGIQVQLTPGEHFFVSGYVGTTLMKAQVEAGKRYYAWVDIGALVLRVKLMPVATSESAQLEEWLNEVQMVEVDQDAMTARHRERESIVNEFTAARAEAGRLGQQDFTEINAEHAY